MAVSESSSVVLSGLVCVGVVEALSPTSPQPSSFTILKIFSSYFCH